MKTNKDSVVKQSGNDVEGCLSQVLFQHNIRIFLQYSVKATNLLQVVPTLHLIFNKKFIGIFCWRGFCPEEDFVLEGGILSGGVSGGGGLLQNHIEQSWENIITQTSALARSNKTAKYLNLSLGTAVVI